MAFIVSNQGDSYVYFDNITNSSDPYFAGGFANLATQQELGILPQRQHGNNSYNPAYFITHWPNLIINTTNSTSTKEIMKIKLSNLLAISALTLGLSACMQSGMDSPPGKYEKTVKSTDAKGTTTERKTSTEVEQNSDGNKKAVIKSTTTKDPKGLMNKTTTNKSTQTIEEERY